MIAWIVYWWQWRRRSWKQRYYAVRYVRERRAMRRRVEAEMRDEFTAEGMDYDAWRRRLSFSCDRDSVDESAGMREERIVVLLDRISEALDKAFWPDTDGLVFNQEPWGHVALDSLNELRKLVSLPPPRDGA